MKATSAMQAAAGIRWALRQVSAAGGHRPGIFGWLVILVLSGTGTARAGYEQPCFIDGCRSADGRFSVTAEPVGKIANHGPNRWDYVWKDDKTGETRRFAARSVSGGQVHAQLFIAPGGATFALFQHVTLWYPEKSDMHGASKLWGDKPGSPADFKHEAFSRRIVIYKNDGTVLKELGICDLLNRSELEAVRTVFTRIEWIESYPGLSFRQTARPAYALCKVSPDYTVLEVRAVAARGSKTNRLVRVSLTDGRIIPADEALPEAKLPVRCFVGPDHLPDNDAKTRESFVPSLDPVRTEGKLLWSAPPPPAELKVIKGGYRKLDTPSWLPTEKILLFADLEGDKLYRFDPSEKAVTEEAAPVRRGRLGPNGRFYGIAQSNLVSWKPGEEPKTLLEKGPNGGTLSLNDLAISQAEKLYFTTLKDPERGRLTVVDLKSGAATIAFDGTDHLTLANPNGVAVSADGKALFVAISNYKDRKHAGLYRFPIQPDGSLDVATGKKARWAKVGAPDGVAVAPDGRICVTDGAIVRVFDAQGAEVDTIRIPAGSGTNLTFGGPDGQTLYVTTSQALYAGAWKSAGKE